MIWEFTADGKLLSFRERKPYYTTKYYHRERSKEMSINLSYFKTLGYELYRLTDRYRVDFVGTDEVWLYLLNNVVDEPQDYREATRLRRCVRTPPR